MSGTRGRDARPPQRYTFLMPTWLKVLLIIFLIGVVLVALAIFLGYRWFRAHEGELREQGQAVVAEAENFGRGKDANACVDESFVRLRRCDGFICEAKTKIFLENCVRTSTVPPGFCDNIPKSSEVLATVTWALNECSRRGMENDKPCTRLVRGLQEICAKQ